MRKTILILGLFVSILKPFTPRVAAFALRPPELDRRITILHGAVRSAKTWACIPKFLYLSRYRTGGVGLVTGVSKQTIYTNVLNDLFNVIGAENYHYNRQSGELNLFGSQWLVMGAKDEGSEKYVRGATIGKVVGDELTLLPRSFVMMLLNRMSPLNARAYFTTNPDHPRHYVKTELIDNAQLATTGALEAMHFTLADNPHVSQEYKDYLNTLYAGVFRERFVQGRWVVAEGAIYRDAWNDARNLYDDATRPKGLLVAGTYSDRFVTVDYGTDHPQVYLDIFDDGKRLWVEREYVWDSHVSSFESSDETRWVPRDSHTQTTVLQKTDAQYADDLDAFLTARFNHRTGRWEPGPRGAAVDAQVLLPPECASFAAELAQRGVWFTDADNAVMDGIRTVSSMLASGLLKIHKDNCPRLVARLATYVWDQKAAARGEEQPLKKDDDEPDALRYGVMTRVGRNPWRLQNA